MRTCADTADSTEYCRESVEAWREELAKSPRVLRRAMKEQGSDIGSGFRQLSIIQMFSTFN